MEDLQQRCTFLETQLNRVLQHLGTQSGTLFAPYERLVQLEQLVQMQQVRIDQLEQTQILYKKDIATYLEEQLQAAQNQRGPRGADFSNTTKFLTTHLVSAVAKLQEASYKTIQESLPVKKMQELEKRLLQTEVNKSTQKATEDLTVHALQTRVALLESQPIQPSQSIVSNQQPTINMEELEQVKQHIQHVETNLLKELQKAYSSTGKPGEIAAPLAKLQATVQTLNQEFQSFRGLDIQKLSQVMIRTANQNLRNEFQTALEQHASKAELQQFQADIQRIEQFSKEVQTGFHKMKTQYETFESNMTNTFHEKRWQKLESSLLKTIQQQNQQQEDAWKTFTSTTAVQSQIILDSCQTAVQKLEKEVRSQYGPDMLQTHLQKLQQQLELKQSQNTHSIAEGFNGKVKGMEESIQAVRRNFLEFSSTIKQELQASELSKRYEAFQDLLDIQQETFKSLQATYEGNMKQLKQHVVQSKQLQTEFSDQLLQVEKELSFMKVSVKDEQGKAYKQLQEWIALRTQSLEQTFVDADTRLQTIQDRIIETKTSVTEVIETHKQLDSSWRHEYTAAQAEFKEQHKKWLSEQGNYVVNRVAELSSSVYTNAKELKEQFDQQIDQVRDDVQKYHKALELSTTHSIQQTLIDNKGHLNGLMKQCQETIRSGIDSLRTFNDRFSVLQKQYETQTSEAIVSEKYKEFQDTLKQEVKAWYAEQKGLSIKTIQTFQTDISTKLTEQINQFVAKYTTLSSSVETNYASQCSSFSSLESMLRTHIVDSQRSFKEQLEQQNESVKAATNLLDATKHSMLEDAKSSLAASLTTHNQSMTKWMTMQKSSIDAHVYKTLEHLKSEFTNGVQTLDSIRTSNETLQTELYAQINEAVTKEKYAEYQSAVEAKLNEWMNGKKQEIQQCVQASQDSSKQLEQKFHEQINEAITREKYQEYQKTIEHRLEKWLEDSTSRVSTKLTDVQNAIESIEEQSKLWEVMLNEQRFRTFVDGIEKRIKQQQDQWTSRRTQEFTDRFETFTSTLQSHKKEYEDFKTLIHQTESSVLDLYKKENTRLTHAQESWAAQKEKEFMHLVQVQQTAIQQYDEKWLAKEDAHKEYIQSWRTQLQTFTQQKSQDLQGRMDALTKVLQDRIDQHIQATNTSLQTSIDSAEQKKESIYKDTDAKLKSILQEWFGKKNKEVLEALDKTMQSIIERQDVVNEESAELHAQRYEEFQQRLQETVKQVQLGVQTFSSEEKARLGVSVKQLEERLTTQIKESMTQQKQSMYLQLSDFQSKLQDIQQFHKQFQDTIYTSRDDIVKLQSLFNQLQSLNKSKEVSIELIQPLLTKQKAELFSQFQERLDSLQLLTSKQLIQEDYSKQEQVHALEIKLQEALLTIDKIKEEVGRKTGDLHKKLEKAHAETHTVESSLKQVEQMFQNHQATLQLISEKQSINPKKDAATITNILEKVEVSLLRHKNEVQAEISSRLDVFKEVNETVKSSLHTSTMELLNNAVATHKTTMLKQVDERLDVFMTAVDQKIPTMTFLDDYHAKKLETLQSNFKKQSETIKTYVESLAEELRTRSQTFYTEVETSMTIVVDSIKYDFKQVSDKWFKEKSELLFGIIEKSNTDVEKSYTKMQALHKFIVDSKDEWISEKQKEFATRLTDTTKLIQGSLQLYTEKEQTKLQETMKALDSKQNEYAVRLSEAIKHVQATLQSITEKEHAKLEEQLQLMETRHKDFTGSIQQDISTVQKAMDTKYNEVSATTKEDIRQLQNVFKVYTGEDQMRIKQIISTLEQRFKSMHSGFESTLQTTYGNRFLTIESKFQTMQQATDAHQKHTAQKLNDAIETLQQFFGESQTSFERTIRQVYDGKLSTMELQVARIHSSKEKEESQIKEYLELLESYVKEKQTIFEQQAKHIYTNQMANLETQIKRIQVYTEKQQLQVQNYLQGLDVYIKDTQDSFEQQINTLFQGQIASIDGQVQLLGSTTEKTIEDIVQLFLIVRDLETEMNARISNIRNEEFDKLVQLIDNESSNQPIQPIPRVQEKQKSTTILKSQPTTVVPVPVESKKKLFQQPDLESLEAPPSLPSHSMHKSKLEPAKVVLPPVPIFTTDGSFPTIELGSTPTTTIKPMEEFVFDLKYTEQKDTEQKDTANLKEQTELISLNQDSSYTSVEQVVPIPNSLHRLRQLQSRLQSQLYKKDVSTSNTLVHIPKHSVKQSSVEQADNYYQSMTKCFYTALIGSEGHLHDLIGSFTAIPGWDYICFTNQKGMKHPVWNCIYVEYTGNNAAAEAKRYKWLSHNHLSDYDVVVWMDAYISPNHSTSTMLQHWILWMKEKNISILHRPHIERTCIWDECTAVVQSKRDSEANVSKVRRILKAGSMPRNWGLFDTNVLIKFHKHLQLQTLSEEIYKQVSTVSNRDQLAISYIYYKNKYTAFGVKNLLSAFNKSGNHVREPIV